MEDLQIIELFWQRSESAVTETARKYGRYCHTIAYNILHSREDSEECVNDTYLNAWRTIPPQRPERLSTFLGKITRNLSLKRWEQYHAEKRGAGQTALALDELAECGQLKPGMRIVTVGFGGGLTWAGALLRW